VAERWIYAWINQFFKTKDYKWENGIYYIPMYMVPFL
jgi:hypothetical protein